MRLSLGASGKSVAKAVTPKPAKEFVGKTA